MPRCNPTALRTAVTALGFVSVLALTACEKSAPTAPAQPEPQAYVRVDEPFVVRPTAQTDAGTVDAGPRLTPPGS